MTDIPPTDIPPTDIPPTVDRFLAALEDLECAVAGGLIEEWAQAQDVLRDVRWRLSDIAAEYDKMASALSQRATARAV